jgi:hypothetical protein
LEELDLGRFRNQGLPNAAFMLGLKVLRRGLEQDDGRVADWLQRMEVWALRPDGSIVAPCAVAEAFLLPWRTRSPSPAIKDRIQTFILKHFGDPRVRKRVWQQVTSADAVAVFKKWLVKVALDQFLEVIDQTVAIERHQWRYRRAFWMAYFEADLISEAHVMFGQTGFDHARQVFGHEVPCARLRTAGKQVSKDHAVLLLRIGRVVVADWSHNGRCAIWKEDAQNVPTFDKTLYHSSDVDADRADWNVRHAGADTYSWQHEVRDYIHRRTGMKPSPESFKVKKWLK